MTPKERQRILVVDDNEAGRYAVARVLQRAGFEVLEAATGAEALQRVAKEQCDLALLDVRLPDMSGLEVCRRIKSSLQTASTLVLQMSASAIDDGSRVQALERGADGYITSPVEPPVLLATVRSLLRIGAAERALQDAALEWQSTFDAIGDGVALLDAEGVVRRSNVALQRALGLNQAELVGRRLDNLLPPAEGESPLAIGRENVQRVKAERTLGERSFSITVDPALDSGDKLGGGVAIVTDITERKLLDLQLRQSQKLESIGLLAGGVAHDFNNLLMGILGNASLAVESLHNPEKARELLKDVVGASERAAELTRQLLAYAGKGRFVTGPVDISTLIRDLVPLIQPSIPRKVRLELDLQAGLPAILADKTQIEQVVMNLIINAGEAIQSEAGSIVVTTSVREFRADELGSFLSENVEPGAYITLQVRDTGSGMDSETLKRIFDPFFSTKFLGRGLGLSAALGITRGHKGAMKVTSERGRGTVFEVLFPIGGEAKTGQTHAVADRVERRETILVVDDEKMVRKLLEKALTYAGYDVLLAENGAEALTIFSREASRISLVVLDLVMPVMSGEEALPQLLAMKSELPVIVSSGQHEEECLQRLVGSAIAGFLQKPYLPNKLVSKVRAVLGTTATVARSGASSD